jgi:hypothetical protein
MKLYRKVFYFLLLVPILLLTYEVRTTLVDMREAQGELFLLNAQRASQQRLIMGLEVRILHYAEGHEHDAIVGCPLCFKNLLMERYDHEMIRKFLQENGINADDYIEGIYDEKRIPLDRQDK